MGVRWCSCQNFWH